MTRALGWAGPFDDTVAAAAPFETDRTIDRSSDEVPRERARRSPTGVPVRTCIGCRRRDERSALLRVVADVDAGPPTDPVVVRPDPRRRMDGRGAWLHPATECVDRAERRRAFARALRVDRGVDTTIVRTFVETLDVVPRADPDRERRTP